MRSILCAVVIVAGAALASADDDPSPPVWAGEVGISYVANSGNTSNSTIGAAAELVWRPGAYKVIASGGFIRTETDGTIGSKRLGTGLRGERTLPLHLSAYGEVTYFEDPPSGTHDQLAANLGGLGHIIKHERRTLDVSLSLTRTMEHRVLVPDRNFLGAQIGLEFTLKVNDILAVEHASSYVRDFSDETNWRVKSSTALAISLNQHLLLKFSHLLYRNKPDPGKHSTDRTILASLQMCWPPKPKS